MSERQWSRDDAIRNAAVAAAAAFERMGWRWAVPEDHQPNAQQIEAALREKLEELEAGGWRAIEGGRFRVEKEEEAQDGSCADDVRLFLDLGTLWCDMHAEYASPLR